MKFTILIAFAAFICQVNGIPFTAEGDPKDPASVICDECKILFQDIKNLVNSSQIKNVTTEAAKSLLCGEDTDEFMYRICDQLTDSLIPPFFQVISELIDPVTLCGDLSLCESREVDQDFNFAIPSRFSHERDSIWSQG